MGLRGCNFPLRQLTSCRLSFMSSARILQNLLHCKPSCDPRLLSRNEQWISSEAATHSAASGQPAQVHGQQTALHCNALIGCWVSDFIASAACATNKCIIVITTRATGCQAKFRTPLTAGHHHPQGDCRKEQWCILRAAVAIWASAGCTTLAAFRAPCTTSWTARISCWVISIC